MAEQVIYTTQEIMNIFKCSRTTVWRMAKRGVIHPVKTSKQNRHFTIIQKIQDTTSDGNSKCMKKLTQTQIDELKELANFLDAYQIISLEEENGDHFVNPDYFFFASKCEEYGVDASYHLKQYINSEKLLLNPDQVFDMQDEELETWGTVLYTKKTNDELLEELEYQKDNIGW